MTGLNIQKWIGGVIAAVVCIIVVVTVAIPIISTNQVESTVENYEALNAMINIIPLLIVVGIIVAVVGMFLYSKKD